MKEFTSACIVSAALDLDEPITLLIVGIEIAATTAITAIVISISTRVKPLVPLRSEVKALCLNIIVYFLILESALSYIKLRIIIGKVS
jgi:hypothetical protein